MALPNRLPPPPRANNPLSHIQMIKNNYLKQLESAPPSSEPAVVPELPAFEALPNELTAMSAPPAVESSPATEPFDIFAFVSPELMAPDLSFDSPGETPALDFLSTPIDALPWESPALIDSNDTFPLFQEVQSLLFGATIEDKAPATIAADPASLIQSNTMYTMPCTPALPPASLFPSPASPATKLPAHAPNGHRKGMTAAQMVPIDAPTQARNYYAESKTSRKAVPAGFLNKAKKRTREEAGFEVDEVDVELTPDLEDAISAKRRQNTLAARKSRARKAETARQQEELIAALTEENTRLLTENDALRMENDTLRRLGH